MHTHETPQAALTRLIDNAVAAATHGLNNGAAPADTIAAMQQRGLALTALRDAMRHELACGTPPPALVAALRRPCGTPCLVRLAIHGRSAAAVIHPIGAASPERELAVWQSLTRYVHGRAA